MGRGDCQKPALRIYGIDMMFLRVQPALRRMALIVCALICLGMFAAPMHAQAGKSDGSDKTAPAGQAGGDKAAADKAAADKATLPPLPPEAHVQQSMELGGKTLHYTVTVGALPVRDGDGKIAGQVVVTAYTMEGENRPVTFAMNGGPGASSVYLNFGAIGPKHLNVGNEGDSPSDPAVLTDNPGTWLDFTDLVFIDPVGTGFSRASVPSSSRPMRRLYPATSAARTAASRRSTRSAVKEYPLDRQFLPSASKHIEPLLD